MECEKKGIICVLCCSHISPGSKKKETETKSEAKFLQNGSVSSSLCCKCRSLISSTMTSKGELEDIEWDVRRRQLELLQELRKLEAQVKNFKMWMVEMNRVAKESTSAELENMLEDNGLLERERWEVMQNRNKVVKVVNNLQECYERICGEGVGRVEKRKTKSAKLSRPDSSGGADADNISDTEDNWLPEDDPDEMSEPVAATDHIPPSHSGRVTVKIKRENGSGDEDWSGPASEVDEEPFYLDNPSDKKQQGRPVQKQGRHLKAKKKRSNIKSDMVSQSSHSAGAQKNKMMCTICGKWMHASNLKKHLRVHTGEKPYTCEICNRQYRQKNHYNTHLRDVHNKSPTGFSAPIPRSRDELQVFATTEGQDSMDNSDLV